MYQSVELMTKDQTELIGMGWVRGAKTKVDDGNLAFVCPKVDTFDHTIATRVAHICILLTQSITKQAPWSQIELPRLRQQTTQAVMFPALGSTQPFCAFKPQIAIGYPAPGYYAALGVSGLQQLNSFPAFVSEGIPVYSDGGSLQQGGQIGSNHTDVGPRPPATNPAAPAPAVTQPCEPLRGARIPSWIDSMLKTSFFVPCEQHKLKKNECTFFCIGCGIKQRGLCQHCMAEHQGHQVIQIRRYVYCDVIRAVDIAQYLDTAGVQCYIINQAKVMFLNPRPQAKLGTPGTADTCRHCYRHLREGAAYCCLACKVAALEAGDCWSPEPCAHDGAAVSESDNEVATPAHISSITPTPSRRQRTPSGGSGGKQQAAMMTRTSTAVARQQPACQPGTSSSSTDVTLPAAALEDGCAMPGGINANIQVAAMNTQAALSPATVALLQIISSSSSDDEVDQQAVEGGAHLEAGNSPCGHKRPLLQVDNMVHQPYQQHTKRRCNMVSPRLSGSVQPGSSDSEGAVLPAGLLLNHRVAFNTANNSIVGQISGRRKQSSPRQSAL